MHNKQMSSQLRELARAAGFFGNDFQNTALGTCQETALQNFAELIVKECMYVGRKSQIDDGLVDADIKKHFGVE